jgi:hypothetical protein
MITTEERLGVIQKVLGLGFKAKKQERAPFPGVRRSVWLSGTQQDPSPLAHRSGEFKLKSGINVSPYGLPPFIPF